MFLNIKSKKFLPFAFSFRPDSILELAQAKRHHYKGRFINPWLYQEIPALKKILYWKISSFKEKSSLKEKNKQKKSISIFKPDLNLLHDHPGPLVCFLGHGSIWLTIENKKFLIDPIFGNIAGIVRRKTPPPLLPQDLPPVDYILITHAHRDHLSLRALAKIKEKPLLIVPLKVAKYISQENIYELDWLESLEFNDLRIRALPVQHWSKRSLWDTNISLWCSFMIESKDFRVFIGGDTGYFYGFKEIGETFGPFDLAFLPVGAYEPRHLMKAFHMNPEEAVQAALDLKAQKVVPIHWGAYRLGDEPLDLPPKIFVSKALEKGLDPLYLSPGEIWLKTNSMKKHEIS